MRCTLGGSAYCIQLELKVVYFCFKVRARGPWDAPLVSLLVVFSYSQKLLIFVLQYGLEALQMLGGSACCIRLDLKVDDFCCKVRARDS